MTFTSKRDNTKYKKTSKSDQSWGEEKSQNTWANMFLLKYTKRSWIMYRRGQSAYFESISTAPKNVMYPVSWFLDKESKRNLISKDFIPTTLLSNYLGKFNRPFHLRQIETLNPMAILYYISELVIHLRVNWLQVSKTLRSTWSQEQPWSTSTY